MNTSKYLHGNVNIYNMPFLRGHIVGVSPLKLYLVLFTEMGSVGTHYSVTCFFCTKQYVLECFIMSAHEAF